MLTFSRYALAAFFVTAGTAHFLVPAPYRAIMPPFIPWPDAIVTISGWLEILGGVGICFRVTRAGAGWGLIALLIAVFPANIQAIFSGMVVAGHTMPRWMLWTRPAFQPLFIAWVYRACLSGRPNEQSMG